MRAKRVCRGFLEKFALHIYTSIPICRNEGIRIIKLLQICDTIVRFRESGEVGTVGQFFFRSRDVQISQM